MTEMLAFARLPGENINTLLARYEAVRQRAAIEGQFVMSTEGCSLQILRARGISAHQFFIMLQPFQGQLPQTDAQFNQLCTQLRRFGHISENAPGNIAAYLTRSTETSTTRFLVGRRSACSSRGRPALLLEMREWQPSLEIPKPRQHMGVCGTIFNPQQEVANSQDLYAAWSSGGGRPTASGYSGYDYYVREHVSISSKFSAR